MKTQIQETREYDKFSFQKGNREIKNKHVADLTVSVSKRNLLPNYPILVNEKFEIIDGQHRFMVSKNGGYPVYYTVIDGATIDDTALVNVNLKSWQLNNFVQMYASKAFKDYVWLYGKMTDEQMFATTLAAFAFGNKNMAGGAHIKSGKLKLSDDDKEMIEKGVDLINLLAQTSKKTRNRTQVYVELHNIMKANKGKELEKALMQTDKMFDGSWPAEQMMEYFSDLIGEYR